MAKCSGNHGKSASGEIFIFFPLFLQSVNTKGKESAASLCHPGQVDLPRQCYFDVCKINISAKPSEAFPLCEAQLCQGQDLHEHSKSGFPTSF